MFLCILLSYPGQSLSLDHVNSGYIRDMVFRVIYKLKQAIGYKPLCLHTAECKGFFPSHSHSSSGGEKLSTFFLRVVFALTFPVIG